MPKVIVTTDDGHVVSSFALPHGHIGNAVWRDMQGRMAEPLGWLGRTIADAQAIEQGHDTERTSEKAMRLSDQG